MIDVFHSLQFSLTGSELRVTGSTLEHAAEVEVCCTLFGSIIAMV